MLALLVSLTLMTGFDPGAAVDTDSAPAESTAGIVDPAAGGCTAAADLEGAFTPVNRAEAVPLCILTYCRDIGERCDYASVDTRKNCCKYTCYTDPTCTTSQNPPNVCKKGWPL